MWEEEKEAAWTELAEVKISTMVLQLNHFFSLMGRNNIYTRGVLCKHTNGELASLA